MTVRMVYDFAMICETTPLKIRGRNDIRVERHKDLKNQILKGVT